MTPLVGDGTSFRLKKGRDTLGCYHPLIGVPDGHTASGKWKYKILKDADSSVYESLKDSGAVLVPCGHCIGCRLDYSREWADRMMLELETSGKALFLTMTYRDAQAHPIEYAEALPPAFLPCKPHEFVDDGVYMVPVSWNLCYRDVQLFMKRLRRECKDLRLRFYCVGEYGDRTHRPHYHMILYGLGLDDILDKKKWSRNNLNQWTYTSVWFDQIWKNGRVVLADVSWNTCAYVARYVTKKLTGPLALDYSLRNCEKEKALMSRKPGIGREYLDIHPDSLDKVFINISTPDCGRKIAIPKYYYNQLKYVPCKDGMEDSSLNPLYNPEKYDKILRERMDFATDRMLLKLQSSGRDYLNYLEVEENEKKNCTKILNHRDSE